MIFAVITSCKVTSLHRSFCRNLNRCFQYRLIGQTLYVLLLAGISIDHILCFCMACDSNQSVLKLSDLNVMSRFLEMGKSSASGTENIELNIVLHHNVV